MSTLIDLEYDHDFDHIAINHTIDGSIKKVTATGSMQFSYTYEEGKETQYSNYEYGEPSWCDCHIKNGYLNDEVVLNFDDDKELCVTPDDDKEFKLLEKAIYDILIEQDIELKILESHL